MPKGKEKEAKRILYIKAASLTDLARYAYNFDFTSKSLIQSRSGSATRLMALGESIGDVTLAYYINVPSPETFIGYTFPTNASDSEGARFIKSIESEKSYINILQLDLGAFKEATKVGEDDVLAMRIGAPEDLMHIAVKKSLGEERFMSLYAFEYGGKRVLCGFDLIEELMDDRKTFYYALLKDNKRAGFARYSYQSNKFEFTETVGEHSYIYVKIINLAEPFPFFKMPE